MAAWSVSPVPPKALLKRLEAGYALGEDELLRLYHDRNAATELEINDTTFNREARKWKAERQEEERVRQIHAKVADKEKSTQDALARKQSEVQQRRDEREERARRIVECRDASMRAHARRQQETFGKIQDEDRRALVRETIRQALVSKTRQTVVPERTMFNDQSHLPSTWTPAPGAYQPKLEDTRTADFGIHPPTTSRGSKMDLPGPGAYDPKYSAGPEYTMRGARTDATLGLGGIVSPGPAAYALVPKQPKGGRIAHHFVKNDVEVAMLRAKQEPGPGQYSPALPASMSKSMGGRVIQESDRNLKASTKCPGPGAYEPQRQTRIRGGDMTQMERKTVLPLLGPGPGEYAPTRTLVQERELQRLSKQVMKMAKVRERNGPDGERSSSEPMPRPTERDPSGTFMTNSGGAASSPGKRSSMLSANFGRPRQT